MTDPNFTSNGITYADYLVSKNNVKSFEEGLANIVALASSITGTTKLASAPCTAAVADTTVNTSVYKQPSLFTDAAHSKRSLLVYNTKNVYATVKRMRDKPEDFPPFDSVLTTAAFVDYFNTWKIFTTKMEQKSLGIVLGDVCKKTWLAKHGYKPVIEALMHPSKPDHKLCSKKGYTYRFI